MTINNTAPSAWSIPKVSELVTKNILYLPISDVSVKNIPIYGSQEELVDLLEINELRMKPLATFDLKYKNSYEGYSKVRLGVYEKLIVMLNLLPKNLGIAYFEGFRPLNKQKEYFDNKLKETLLSIKDKETAYYETSKLISPFIDNIPTHCTGAAIDITLFHILENGATELIDMGKFDVIFGVNDQQETFSENTSQSQRLNRLILLEAATNAGLINYGYEWWHYSYGDKMWAYVTGKESAIYGLAVDKNDPILFINKDSYLAGF